MAGNLAVIPARSGSKGLKDKNIAKLAGKPLMAHTIEAAVQSGVFDEIMVSTDSPDYARIAEQYGAAVPYLRQEETAGDTASSWDVVREVLAQYATLGRSFSHVMLLQPTSPLRNAEDIKKAYRLFVDRDAEAVISVCEVDYQPWLINTLPPDLTMDGFIGQDGFARRRQDMDVYYRINGAIYLVRTRMLTPDFYLYGPRSFAYIMDKQKSIDIDDRSDLRAAEVYLSQGA